MNTENAPIGVATEVQLLDQPVMRRMTFNGSLNEAVRHCCLEDQEIADQIGISHGYMSRFMRGVGQQWAKRLIAFMRTTNSLAPLQWMADQMGCELVPMSSKEARIRELEAALAAERRAA